MTKALTLHQPWASLVALGVKTLETRSWATKYRGRLLIHAAAAMTRAQRSLAYADPIGGALNEHGVYLGGDCAALPRGAIVASCTLADVVPMLAAGPATSADVAVMRETGAVVVGEQAMAYYRGGMGPDGLSVDVSDQRPYGDFAPGRFAWLLEDVKPTTERCPACWRDYGTPPVIRWEPLIEDGRTVGARAVHDGPCVFTNGQCSCGVLEIGAAACATCRGAGYCDPVPARGRQQLWEWTP